MQKPALVMSKNLTLCTNQFTYLLTFNSNLDIVQNLTLLNMQDIDFLSVKYSKILKPPVENKTKQKQKNVFSDFWTSLYTCEETSFVQQK